MKRIVILIFLIIFFCLIFLKKQKFYQYEINEKKYKLLIADTQKKWQEGLMFYKNKKELKGADGMIFIFPDKDYRTFWNKNTYLDLDIYWINDEKIEGKSYLQSIEKTKKIFIVNSSTKVNKVIELIR